MNDVQKRVEVVLNSLDSVERATPGPYFYTRVRARLANGETAGLWDRVGSVISRPSIALSGLALICLVNIVVAVSKQDVRYTYAAATEQVTSEDYVVNASANYEEEIQEQP